MKPLAARVEKMSQSLGSHPALTNASIMLRADMIAVKRCLFDDPSRAWRASESPGDKPSNIYPNTDGAAGGLAAVQLYRRGTLRATGG